MNGGLFANTLHVIIIGGGAVAAALLVACFVYFCVGRKPPSDDPTVDPEQVEVALARARARAARRNRKQQVQVGAHNAQRGGSGAAAGGGNAITLSPGGPAARVIASPAGGSTTATPPRGHAVVINNAGSMTPIPLTQQVVVIQPDGTSGGFGAGARIILPATDETDAQFTHLGVMPAVAAVGGAVAARPNSHGNASHGIHAARKGNSSSGSQTPNTAAAYSTGYSLAAGGRTVMTTPPTQQARDASPAAAQATAQASTAYAAPASSGNATYTFSRYADTNAAMAAASGGVPAGQQPLQQPQQMNVPVQMQQGGAMHAYAGSDYGSAGEPGQSLMYQQHNPGSPMSAAVPQHAGMGIGAGGGARGVGPPALGIMRRSPVAGAVGMVAPNMNGYMQGGGGGIMGGMGAYNARGISGDYSAFGQQQQLQQQQQGYYGGGGAPLGMHAHPGFGHGAYGGGGGFGGAPAPYRLGIAGARQYGGGMAPHFGGGGGGGGAGGAVGGVHGPQ